jgi:hypothetical protein
LPKHPTWNPERRRPLAAVDHCVRAVICCEQGAGAVTNVEDFNSRHSCLRIGVLDFFQIDGVAFRLSPLLDSHAHFARAGHDAAILHDESLNDVSAVILGRLRSHFSIWPATPRVKVTTKLVGVARLGAAVRDLPLDIIWRRRIRPRSKLKSRALGNAWEQHRARLPTAGRVKGLAGDLADELLLDWPRDRPPMSECVDGWDVLDARGQD